VFAAKAGALLVVVTLVIMFVPFGFWLSLLVWFIGFWLVLEIDPREALILVGVVFAMSIVVNLFLWALIMSAGPAPTAGSAGMEWPRASEPWAAASPFEPAGAAR
jgi:hypothetical protein